MIIQWISEAGGQWSRTCSLNFLSPCLSLSHYLFLSFFSSVPSSFSLLLYSPALYACGCLFSSSSSNILQQPLFLRWVKARLGCWEAIYPLCSPLHNTSVASLASFSDVSYSRIADNLVSSLRDREWPIRTRKGLRVPRIHNRYLSKVLPPFAFGEPTSKK